MRQAIFVAKSRALMRRDYRAVSEMRRTERLPAAAVRSISEARSADIAAHAFRTTEYYRQRFAAAGFTETDVAQPQNFAELPVLTKTDIQDAGLALASSATPSRSRLTSRTGGSTGSPLEVFNDRRAPVAALWWRIYSWWGIQPSDNVAFIYRQARMGAEKLRYDAQWWPTRHILLNARGTTDDAMRVFERDWRKTRPRLLVGYVEGVREFAEYVAQNNVLLPPLAAISVTASMLHPGQRDLIQQALGANVYDTYRTAEVPWIAAECTARDGLHVLADHRRVEVVDTHRTPVATGEVGDVVVTDLDNRAFPLIRYAIGDQTRWLDEVDCACGRPLPRIDNIRGRIADVLRTPSGRIASGGFSGLFVSWPGVIRQFQLRQAADYSVDLTYVVGADPAQAEEAARHVVGVVSGFLNDEVPVRSRSVDQIESSDGKARLVISEVGTSL